MGGYVILTEVKDQAYYTLHSEIEDKDGNRSSSWGTKTRKTLDKVALNVDHIIAVRENNSLGRKPENLPEGLDDRHDFCRVTLTSGMNSRHIDVVGDLDTVTKKIWGNAR